MIKKAIMAGLLILVSSWAASYGDPAEDALLIYQGIKVNYRYAVLLAPPESETRFEFRCRQPSRTVRVEECIAQVGECRAETAAVRWRTPARGGTQWLRVKLHFGPAAGGRGEAEREEWVLVAVLVGFPSSLLQDGFLNGFELGRYPDWQKMKHPERYRPPSYFYYLDEEVMGLFLSEHIHLGDLGYDGRAPLPQYFALDYNLVRKLEAIMAELKGRGLPCRLHYVGGGFISPKSNQQRTTKDSAAAELSRHLWGEAVDLIVDESPRDEIMDDLNRDGRIDVRDAFLLRDLIRHLEAQGKCTPGGIGIYAPPRHSRIQLHVDVRGYSTDWGVKTFEKEFADAPPRKSLRPGGGR